MTNGTLTEPRQVGKKKPRPEKPTEQPSANPPFGRIEVQAPPEWIMELDEVAAAMGLSRSAYIRQACNRQMAADRKALGLDDDRVGDKE